MRTHITLSSVHESYKAISTLWAETIKPALVDKKRLVLEVRTETRSTQSNAMMWSILTDLSRQVIWHGQKLAPSDWKTMATAALKRQRVVPGLDGGFVVLGDSTSKMTVGEMSELIEFLYALGSQHEVRWSRTSLGRDVPDEVCAA